MNCNAYSKANIVGIANCNIKSIIFTQDLSY